MITNKRLDLYLRTSQIDSILLDSRNDDYKDCPSSCCDWDTTFELPCPRIFKIYFWYGSSFELNYSVLSKTYCYQLWWKNRLVWILDGLEEW